MHVISANSQTNRHGKWKTVLRPELNNEEDEEGEKEVWSDSDTTEFDARAGRDSEEPPNEMGVVTVDETPKSLASWLLIFFIRLQAHFHLSDVVLGTILRFLGIFFTVLGHRFSSVCAEIAHVFPRSVHTLTVSYGLKDMQIQRYVVCRKCHTIYFFKNCIEGYGATQRSKTCSHKAFPNHPHLRRRLPCGTLLLKSVELASQRKILYPFKIYCYLNLKCSLQSMLLIPGLGLACEQWRLRQVSTGVLEDVYDGNVWKDFQHIRGQSFLSDPFALGLMLNIDWFEPYKHLTYSVGVIYLSYESST